MAVRGGTPFAELPVQVQRTTIAAGAISDELLLEEEESWSAVQQDGI